MLLEDHMLKDPFPPERLELLKIEIKAEIKNELNSLIPQVKTPENESDTSDMNETKANSFTKISKRIDKMEAKLHENGQISEAKL